jgi:hypothetical protein
VNEFCETKENTLNVMDVEFSNEVEHHVHDYVLIETCIHDFDNIFYTYD